MLDKKTDVRRVNRFVFVTVFMLLVACSQDNGEEPASTAPTTVSEASPAPAPELIAGPELPDPADALAGLISICTIPNPEVPSSAFTIFNAEPNARNDYWVRYECKETCTEWQQCLAPAYLNDKGEPIMHGRHPELPKKALAFVVDSMGGQLVFSDDGNKTVVIHAGAGGTRFYVDAARVLEERSTARTVMVRWEKGFVTTTVQPPFPGPVHWGWYSRTAEEGTTIRALNSRVASIIAWTHEHLSADAAFGTWGCSMGTNATFGPVLWHGLDPIIDYQLFVGGPNMWDLNAQCGRRQYTEGYCDMDGVTACENNADCAALGNDARCRMPRPYAEIDKVFDIFANHVHATTACRIAVADATTQPHPAFDQSSMAYIESADWVVDHRVDFLVNVGAEQGEFPAFGGDEYWGLGDFPFIFNRIEPVENKQWHAYPNSHHCDGMKSGAGHDLIISRMGL